MGKLAVALGFLIMAIALYLLIKVWRIIATNEKEQQAARQHLKLFRVKTPEAN